MADESSFSPGHIAWVDLTVPDATPIRDFYQSVIGWTNSPVKMDDYEDYCMVTPGGSTVAGICNAKGHNADLPPVWLIYVMVANLDDSLKRCTDKGGKVRVGPKNMGSEGRYAVIEDPAGVVLAIYERS